MFSVIANVQSTSGSPTSVMQDQFRETLIAAYENMTVVTKLGIAHQEQAQPGKNTIVYSIRGQGTSLPSRSTKAVGDLPQQGAAATYNITSTYDEAEYLDYNYDHDKYGDTRFQVAAADTQIELIRAAEDREKRFMAMLTKASQAAALTGFDPAPVLAQTATGSTTMAAIFTNDNTGAELVFKYVVQIKTQMRSGTAAVVRNCSKGPNWLVIMRPEIWDCYKFGTRSTSTLYNLGADMKKEPEKMIDGCPVVVVPSGYWPLYNTAYTDQSFSKYNVDATYNQSGSTLGSPVLFIVNYGAGVSPITETIPPTSGGISVKLLDEPYREVMTVRIKSRYGYDIFRRSAVGCLNFID